MQAVMVREHGDLSKLILEERPEPQPGPGQVRVRVHAAGMNHLDVWLRRGVPGHAFPLPLIPGSDASGVVDALGPGVTDLEVGAPVVLAPGVSRGVCALCLAGRDHHCRKYAILGEHCDGTYAECVLVPRANVLAKPANLSYVQAAALGVAHLTAWTMLVRRAELCPGETLLVQAAASGVGSAAVQIGKLLGATVIAVASTAAKLEHAKALGADHLLNSQTDDVAKKVKGITAGQGAHVVFEHVGPATWPQSIKALAWQGRLVTCGSTTGGEVPLNLRLLFFKSISLLGSTMGSKGDFYQVIHHAAAGRLLPVIDRTLPLAEVRAAQELLETRQVCGKVVLTMPNAPAA